MSIVARFVQPRGLGLNLLPLRGRNFRERSVLSFAASQEESKPSGIEIKKEEDLKVGAEESAKAWKQTYVSAIRFGIILGGTFLAISMSSLRSWNKGELLPLALKGQTCIYFTGCLTLIRPILYGSKVTMAVQGPSYPMDRAFILGDAVDYLKELLQRINDIHNEFLRMH